MVGHGWLTGLAAALCIAAAIGYGAGDPPKAAEGRDGVSGVIELPA